MSSADEIEAKILPDGIKIGLNNSSSKINNRGPSSQKGHIL